MPVLKIPAPIRSYVDGHLELKLSRGTVNAAFQSLLEQFPALKAHLTNERGEMRPFVNLFLNGENVRDLPQGLETPIAESDVLQLLFSVAGG